MKEPAEKDKICTICWKSRTCKCSPQALRARAKLLELEFGEVDRQHSAVFIFGMLGILGLLVFMALLH